MLHSISRELLDRSRHPKHPLNYPRQAWRYDGKSKGYQRYMALTALPRFIPKSASMEKGVYCAGYDARAREHTDRSRKDQRLNPSCISGITDRSGASCWPRGQCRLLPNEIDYMILETFQFTSSIVRQHRPCLRYSGLNIRIIPVDHHGMVPIKGSTEYMYSCPS